MSEDRFRSHEGNMAEKIARRLPGVHDMEYNEPFYRNVMNWCLKNYDLMRLFSRVIYDEDKFMEFLERCKEEENVEAFGMAIALRLEWLQKN